MTEKPLAFLSLVKVLETTVGHRTGYAILEPFPCTTLQNGQPAIIAIQNAGKIIAQHIGLGDLTFVISVTKHDERTAGHIELNRDGNNVFVEIATDVCQYKDAVLSTICHELSHKYLHVHGIRHGFDHIEQEYLTDVTAVYLGLGKIMLNGCECQSSTSRRENGQNVTTTHTLRTGYISRECFAFVYCLIGAMRDLPRQMLFDGVSAEAQSVVSRVEQEYGNWFRREYRNPDEIERLAGDLGESIMLCQDDAADKHQRIRNLYRLLREIECRTYEAHKPLRQAQRSISELSQSQPNPHLRFLSYLETREGVGAQTLSSRQEIAELRLALKHFDGAISGLVKGSDNPESEVLECPLDRTKLRVPGGRNRILVTCPTCKYKFVVKTASGAVADGKTTGKATRAGLLKSLKAVFGRE